MHPVDVGCFCLLCGKKHGSEMEMEGGWLRTREGQNGICFGGVYQTQVTSDMTT